MADVAVPVFPRDALEGASVEYPAWGEVEAAVDPVFDYVEMTRQVEEYSDYTMVVTCLIGIVLN